MGSCRSPDTIAVSFDDEHLVADAGLILAATLAEGLLLRELFDEGVDLGDAPGAANVGDKAMTLVYSALARGAWIGDADWLRAGATGQVLGHRGLHPPRWARSCARSPGARPVSSTRSPAKRSPEPGRLGRAPAPGRSPSTSTPPIARPTGSPSRAARARQAGLREGVAHSGRGAASFLAEAVNRARRAGATGPIMIRADSAFYNHKVLAACQQQGVRCSISAKLTKRVRNAITHIPDHAWTPVPYWLDDGADVVETS